MSFGLNCPVFHGLGYLAKFGISIQAFGFRASIARPLMASGTYPNLVSIIWPPSSGYSRPTSTIRSRLSGLGYPATVVRPRLLDLSRPCSTLSNLCPSGLQPEALSNVRSLGLQYNLECSEPRSSGLQDNLEQSSCFKYETSTLYPKQVGLNGDYNCTFIETIADSDVNLSL
ncbi:hypothetical protein LR48_Vigan03g086300 [Vigna angularis]|uniref:Uncharacterized protein n=1 Tax=Phaseolus angularis TaxID=3914 RepID=A0A0L9U3Z2_PHAAN|nr:hypothetical protein LR48_Vigan03g086300 [Vigna angularis]